MTLVECFRCAVALPARQKKWCSERCRRLHRQETDPESGRRWGRTYRERHPEKAKEAARKWRVDHPGWWKKYAKDQREYMARWHQENKDRRRDQQRSRYAANPEKYVQKSRAYQTRRAGLEQGPVDYADIVLRDRGLCRVCLKRVAKRDQSFDHIIPVSKGGPHTQSNIQLTHKACNSKRGAGRIAAQTLIPFELL